MTLFIGITYLPKNYNPVITIFVYSGVPWVSEVSLVQICAFGQNLESTLSKASGIQGDVEYNKSLFFSGIDEWVSKWASAKITCMQCLLMQRDFCPRSISHLLN